jgi:hypothetical protein
MKIEPSFCDHWKTKRLHRICGAEAVLGLLRLWGQAKIKRQYTGLVLNPTKLAAVMEYCGDEDALWRVMTDETAPWLDKEPEGTWALHGYAEHQAQIIRLWEIGRKGGRPKATPPSPIPPSPNTSSSSSSSPICEPNGNHMVSDRSVVSTPSLKEWLEQCGLAGIEAELAEEIWHDNEGRGCDPWGHWLDYRGNPIRNPISNAKSRAVAMRRKRGGTINGQAHNGTRKPATAWEIKQSIEAAQKEASRLEGDPQNKEPIDPETPWDRRLKPSIAVKVKELRGRAQELTSKLALLGKEAA